MSWWQVERSIRGIFQQNSKRVNLSNLKSSNLQVGCGQGSGTRRDTDTPADRPAYSWRCPANLVNQNACMIFQVLQYCFDIRLIPCEIIFDYAVIGVGTSWYRNRYEHRLNLNNQPLRIRSRYASVVSDRRRKSKIIRRSNNFALTLIIH